MINRKRSEALSSNNLGYSNPALKIWNVVIYSDSNDLPSEILEFLHNKFQDNTDLQQAILDETNHYVVGSYVKEIADAIKVQLEQLSQRIEYSIRTQVEPT